MRKLASVKTIDEIKAIDGADRIEAAEVGGWSVVVGKGEFSAGDKCVYFEIDSCLDVSDPHFSFLAPRGVKKWRKLDENTGDIVEVEGHVLRTAKLRGQISQGLAMTLESLGIDDNVPVGTDVSDELKVIKYDPYAPCNSQRVGSYPDKYAVRSDCERIQNLSDHMNEILQHEWYATVKADGYSFTVLEDENGEYRAATKNQEVKWDEETPEIHVAREAGIIDALEPCMAVQFEFVGPKSNGNRLGLRENEALVFSVFRNHVAQSRNEWPQAMLDHAVPVISIQLPDNVRDIIEQANGLRGNIVKDRSDEGIVWHTVDGNGLDCLNGRDCFKAINNKYLLKHGE